MSPVQSYGSKILLHMTVPFQKPEETQKKYKTLTPEELAKIEERKRRKRAEELGIDLDGLFPAGEADESVVFTTTAELHILPSELTRLVTAHRGGEQTDRTGALAEGRDIPCFQATPEPGDALLFGLPTAVPGCIVAVRLDSRVEGVGVDPRRPLN